MLCSYLALIHDIVTALHPCRTYNIVTALRRGWINGAASGPNVTEPMNLAWRRPLSRFAV